MPVRRRIRRSRRYPDRHVEQLLQSLLDLYQLLRTPLPLDDLLQTILDTALAWIPGAQRGSLLVRDGDYLYYRAVRGYDLLQLQQVRFPVAAVHAMFAADQRTMQIQGFEVWDSAHLDAHANFILHTYGHIGQIRRSLMAPINVSHQLYGTLVLDNLRSHAPFPLKAEVLARLFAEQAGGLIDQALLLDQLRQANTMLVETEKLASLGRFVASIAHEINNPLTAVLAYAEFLSQNPLDTESRQLLMHLLDGAERVRIIVRNLQIFARQQKSSYAEVDLNLLIEQTLTLKRADFALDQIEVRCLLHPDLPCTWGDAGQLSQVLLNLLVNAQHALHERDGQRIITVQTQLAGEGGSADPTRLLISISDNGPGIDPEIIHRIFEPFFTTRPANQGTGLGLSISYGIVANHGGHIWALSSPGEGATFCIELPICIEPPSLDGAAALPRVSRPSPPQGRHILLIEDEPLVVQALQHALGQANTLVIARQGAIALQYIVEQRFDLVICDLRLPGMNGLVVYQQVQVLVPQLARCFLFITGDTNGPIVRTVLRQTSCPLLAKPFTPSELYLAIEQVMGRE